MVGRLIASAAMTVQDQCGGTLSNVSHPAGDVISLKPTLRSITSSQSEEPIPCRNDYTPKVRKPYTITKQRERWTEEEHKKFLDALKLYGRAWRRIEEHVGTKTAVQIRSHAQKFFSKVVRESSGNETSSVEPIEIPPPRPKRKPMHPYPRKVMQPLNKIPLALEKPLRSSSLDLFVSEQENQSPTSVLSVVVPNAIGSVDSNSPSGSSSPVSSTSGASAADFTPSEPSLSAEDDRCHLPSPQVPHNQCPKVGLLELCPNENVMSEEYIYEETSKRTLKLFGTTVLVTECHRPSSPAIGTSKLSPWDLTEPKPDLTLACTFKATELKSGSQMPQHQTAFHSMDFQTEKSSNLETDSITYMPWWHFCRGMSFAFTPSPKQEHSKANLDSNDGVEDKEIHIEGSWTGSNFGSNNGDENADKSYSHSRWVSCDERQLCWSSGLKASESSVSTRLRASPERSTKGFVPYKKRMAERDTLPSLPTGEGRKEQRIRLSL
ncbi:hypothetical protein K2173_019803 [Erythroxylum novogranatense]|uniref:Uncharacterized protein n=1 Tax=Erythroxylum novogranatense TaxID=1862640 RepID=A0AAV8SN63_9ROSI|nr:hypothetical protein K2173_019803 [Erythroxylum novogranatense]